jgi:hypothetical protein
MNVIFDSQDAVTPKPASRGKATSLRYVGYIYDILTSGALNNR